MFIEETHDGDLGRPGRRRSSIRRFFPDPWWSRFKRALVALAGVVVMVVVSDAGLLLVVAAATSPVWDESERDVAGQVRWREMLGKVMWRTSAVLLYGAVAGLVAHRWFATHADLSAARIAAALGITSLLLALVPPPLGPLLWTRFPAGLRRVERTARLVEELARAVPPKRSRLRLELLPQAAKPRSMVAAAQAKVEFDPELGASGRPRPTHEYFAGSPRRPRPTANLGVRVKWSDGMFTVADFRGRKVTFPAVPESVASGPVAWDSVVDGAGRRGEVPRAVAEMAVLVTLCASAGAGSRRRASLLFLDQRGYCFLEVAKFRDSWKDISRFAAEVDVTCRSYSVKSQDEVAGKVQNLMFPRTWRCQRFLT